MKEHFKNVYRTLCVENWSPLIGGIMIAFFVILLEMWYRPWGIVGGLRNWADWVFYGLGLYEDAPPHPLWFSSSVLNIGFLWGAFISATLAREFSLRVPPGIEFVKAIVAGILMGIGSALAMGCNIGGMYMAINNLAANGLLMWIGLVIGVRFAVKYLYWEIEHLPSGGGFEINLSKINPLLAILAIIGLVWAGKAYFGSEKDMGATLGGCLILTAGIGYAMHRSRLCIVNALREPFMSGEAAMARAVIVSLLLTSIGIAIIKLAGIRDEMAYVTPTFGLGALVGGIIFGFGMTVAGGCGSGSLWRVAEGQLKLWVVAIFFGLSNSLVRHLFSVYEILYVNEDGELVSKWLGKSVFLPDYLGYAGTILLIAVFLVIWRVLVDWNEETNRFVLEL